MGDRILMHECPTCGAEETLVSVINRAIADDEVRALLQDLLGRNFPLGGALLRYSEYFKPPKHALNWTRVRKVFVELVPLIRAPRLNHGGREVRTIEADWIEAFGAVFSGVEKGFIKLPLTHSNYLLTAVTSIAARAESEGRLAPTQPVASGRDPALLKIEQDSQLAGRIPESVRVMRAQLTGKKEES